jgi:hypothetical protein
MSTNLWSGRWNGRRPAGDPHSRAREVISPSGGIMRGKFPSRKNGRMVHHEGLLELDAIYLMEASPEVISYREQPTTITYPDGNRIRRYTPDLEVALHTGQSVWIEVKPTAYLAKEETRHKLERVTHQLQRNGQPFVILTEEVLRQQPRQSNIRAICHRAMHARLTGERANVVMTKCAADLPTSLERTTQLLASHGLDPYRLLQTGHLRCALDSPLSPATLISQAKEGDDGWFWLAKAHGF